MTRFVQTAFPAEPGELWTQPVNFGPKLPTGTPAASPTVAVSGGHAGATAEVGTYDVDTETWTPDPDGQWVLVEATAGETIGDRFLVTVGIDAPNGVISFYKPVARHS